ncbi:MAG: branched-chain amino acid ABC transporter permease [Acidimicrobiales bacterium]
MSLMPDSELQNRQDKIAVVERGRLSIPLTVGIATCAALVAIVPVGRSGIAGLMWVWLFALLGLIAANLLVPVASRNGVMVKWVSIAAFLGFMLLIPIGRAGSTMTDLGLFAIFGAVVVGMNLTQGFAGQISLAQAAFLGIGAYTSVLLDFGEEISLWGLRVDLPDLPFLATIPIAIGMSMLLSVLIGFPALRVQGPWLAFVTLAFNLLVFLVLNNETELTRGSRGIRVLRSDFELFGIDMLPTNNFYYVGFVYLLICLILVWWIIRCPWGRALKSIRDNPARASSLGVDVRAYTLLAFAIGSGMAGGAGAIYARQVEFIEPRSFYINQSFDFLLATVVGGLGTFVGPLLGTSTITLLADYLRFTGDWYRVWFGLFVIIMMLIAPEGMAGSFNRFRAWLLQRRRSA